MIKKVLLGENGTKGILSRSGILTAIITTLFVVIDGYASGSISETLSSQKESLMPMWTAAMMVLVGNPSKSA